MPSSVWQIISCHVMGSQIVSVEFSPGAKGLLVESASEDILETYRKRDQVGDLQYKRKQNERRGS